MYYLLWYIIYTRTIQSLYTFISINAGRCYLWLCLCESFLCCNHDNPFCPTWLKCSVSIGSPGVFRGTRTHGGNDMRFTLDGCSKEHEVSQSAAATAASFVTRLPCKIMSLTMMTRAGDWIICTESQKSRKYSGSSIVSVWTSKYSKTWTNTVKLNVDLIHTILN